jgi:hypothetical protein
MVALNRRSHLQLSSSGAAPECMASVTDVGRESLTMIIDVCGHALHNEGNK